MVLFAYTIPGVAWLVFLFVQSKTTKTFYAGVYFVCHLTVELYGFWLPIIWFFINEGQYDQMSADQKQQVRDYLIVNSVIFAIATVLTSYCTACLCSYASNHAANRSGQASYVYSPKRQQYVEMQQQDNYIGGGYYQPNQLS